MTCTPMTQRGATRNLAPSESEPTHAGPIYRPNVDIVETPDELLLHADVPGATAQDIDVHYERGLLTLHARIASRQAATQRALQREYGVGDFARTFEIGEGVDAQNITADVSAGVLTLRLPKSAAARVRKIAVRGS